MSHVARRNLAKLSARTLAVLCKYFVGFLDNGALDLMEDLVDSHSYMVDPKEFSVSTAFFQLLSSE